MKSIDRNLTLMWKIKHNRGVLAGTTLSLQLVRAINPENSKRKEKAGTTQGSMHRICEFKLDRVILFIQDGPNMDA